MVAENDEIWYTDQVEPTETDKCFRPEKHLEGGSVTVKKDGCLASRSQSVEFQVLTSLSAGNISEGRDGYRHSFICWKHL